jgi:hypothetical protein
MIFRLFVLACVLLYAGMPAGGQEMPVPVDVQYPLFTRILTFDRNLQRTNHATITIGVLYQPNVRMSTAAKDDFFEAASRSPSLEVFGRTIDLVGIEFTSPDHLEDSLAAAGIAALYLTPMRTIDIGALTAIAEKYNIITMTGVPEYVDMGVVIGIETRGDRPVIIINLPRARAAGADLSSQLLKLARIIE